MLESNLKSGKQAIPADPRQLDYGVSITDACLDWQHTEAALRELRDSLKEVLPQRTREMAVTNNGLMR